MARIWNKHKQSNTPLKRKVFVAMSGGVDSSVAAALLKEQGYEVIGAHIKMWSDPEIPCNFKEDRYDAMRAAAYVGIPFETWDLTAEYKQAVVEYMIREYAAGRTPNPDVMCNREIKFGVFLRCALEQGADFIATGHYVRIKPSRSVILSESEGSHRDSSATSQNDGAKGYYLLQAKDNNKDQSYFLWTLVQKHLQHCLFPIGEYIKPEVRAMAKKLGLPNADKPDSQGICFIGEIDMAEFLKKYIPIRRGLVVTTAGKVIGEHEGISFYTIGQRHGLRLGGGPSPRRSELWPREGGIPYYVVEKDSKTNTLVVAEGPYDDKLFSNKLTISDINWISGKEPKLPLKCEARIRYRQPLQRCTVKKTNGVIRVCFEEPQRAITPGQSVVLYFGEEMLGGGVIR